MSGGSECSVVVKVVKPPACSTILHVVSPLKESLLCPNKPRFLRSRCFLLVYVSKGCIILALFTVSSIVCLEDLGI